MNVQTPKKRGREPKVKSALVKDVFLPSFKRRSISLTIESETIEALSENYIVKADRH